MTETYWRIHWPSWNTTETEATLCQYERYDVEYGSVTYKATRMIHSEPLPIAGNWYQPIYHLDGFDRRGVSVSVRYPLAPIQVYGCEALGVPACDLDMTDILEVLKYD